VAGYSDPEYVRQLWDVHLKATVDAAAKSGGPCTQQCQHLTLGRSDPVIGLWVHGPSVMMGSLHCIGDGDGDTTPGLAAAAAEMEALGQRFYPNANRWIPKFVPMCYSLSMWHVQKLIRSTDWHWSRLMSCSMSGSASLNCYIQMGP
jgi:hypothetical protein